jgi:hypothetical protein
MRPPLLARGRHECAMPLAQRYLRNLVFLYGDKTCKTTATCFTLLIR